MINIGFGGRGVRKSNNQGVLLLKLNVYNLPRVWRGGKKEPTLRTWVGEVSGKRAEERSLLTEGAKDVGGFREIRYFARKGV